jgi:hypothetical protein
MTHKSTDFLERLSRAEEISPALRASYQAEMDAMLQPKLSARRALPGIGLLVVFVIGTAALVRNMFVYNEPPLVFAAWATLAIAFSAAAFYIGRDLWRGKHSPKSAFSISWILTFAAGSMTAASLVMGLSAPPDPSSMFNAFFLFVFYFACSEWSMHNRIAAAELAAREQMLRIECRLADLAERLTSVNR